MVLKSYDLGWNISNSPLQNIVYRIIFLAYVRENEIHTNLLMFKLLNPE